MKVRVLTSHILPGQRIAEEGDVLELSDHVARVKVAQGYVEPFVEAEGSTPDIGDDAEESAPDETASEADEADEAEAPAAQKPPKRGGKGR